MIILNGAILLEGGKVAAAEIVVDGDTIASVRLTGGMPGDVLILPGIVDFHGDAFEREIMPRPGVVFPLDVALREVDLRLASNGITTAYHAITASWEPGLRSVDQLEAVIAALAEQREMLGVDHRVHLRFETYSIDAVDRLRRIIDSGQVGLVAFNDHLPGIHRDLEKPTKAGEYASRAGISVEEYRARAEALLVRGNEVGGAMAVIADAACVNGITLATHDGRSRIDHGRYAELGCTVAEFPVTEEAVACARADGQNVVMGAPNIVRGGSHKADGMSARDHALAGTCTILASDYYYPAPLRAAFELAASGDMELGAAWRLVSENPARALGLDDRGRLAAGLRADMVLVNRGQLDCVKVLATIAGGRVVYAIHEASHLLTILGTAA